jgi:hypothetical protein
LKFLSIQSSSNKEIEQISKNPEEIKQSLCKIDLISMLRDLNIDDKNIP